MSKLEKICSEIAGLQERLNHLKPASVEIKLPTGGQFYTGTGTIVWSGTNPAMTYTTTTSNTWVGYAASSGTS